MNNAMKQYLTMGLDSNRIASPFMIGIVAYRYSLIDTKPSKKELFEPLSEILNEENFNKAFKEALVLDLLVISGMKKEGNREVFTMEPCRRYESSYGDLNHYTKLMHLEKLGFPKKEQE